MKINPRTLVIAAALTLGAGPANAIMYDLTDMGSNSASVNGAIFNTIFDQPAGTGYIDPFLRTQLLGQPGPWCDPSSPTGGNCEQGYNTDGTDEFDTKDAGGHNWDHSILLSDIPIVNVGGVDYREFLLDINQLQNLNRDKLSLDELQFFLTDNRMISGYDDANNDFNTSPDNQATLVWTLDDILDTTADTNWLKLQNCKDPGTCGSGDMDLQALIPNSVFGSDENQYVVLFNRFGDNAGLGGGSGSTDGANDGFEEWSYRIAQSTTSVPEPGMLPLLFAGIMAIWMVRRRAPTMAA